MRPTTPLLPLELAEVTFDVGGKRIIDRVSLRIDAGPRTVILGPNGSGKSVLMRLCHGLLQPTSGRIRYGATQATDAVSNANSGDVRRRHAMVFQRPVMLRRSALDNVAYGLAVAGMPRRQRLREAALALERVGLGRLAKQPARVLSGGEQQRLAIARAWALRPELLFLDEPTANLDPSATQAIEAAIQAMHESGTKIVLVTHNLGQAHRLGDEVLFMESGRVTERAAVRQFFQSPASSEAAAYLRGEMPWR